MISTILFDNDGVLVDTEGVFYESNCRMLREFGVELGEAEFSKMSLSQGMSLADIIVSLGYTAETAETAVAPTAETMETAAAPAVTVTDPAEIEELLQLSSYERGGNSRFFSRQNYCSGLEAVTTDGKKDYMEIPLGALPEKYILRFADAVDGYVQ